MGDEGHAERCVCVHVYVCEYECQSRLHLHLHLAVVQAGIGAGAGAGRRNGLQSVAACLAGSCWRQAEEDQGRTRGSAIVGGGAREAGNRKCVPVGFACVQFTIGTVRTHSVDETSLSTKDPKSKSRSLRGDAIFSSPAQFGSMRRHDGFLGGATI